MVYSLNLELKSDEKIFARIEQFLLIPGEEILDGVEFIFSFTFRGTENATSSELEINDLQIELFVLFPPHEPAFVASFSRPIRSPVRMDARPRNLERRVKLTQVQFLNLVEQTHAGDLQLKFVASAEAFATYANAVERIILDGEGYAKIPHSEWINALNRTGFERFTSVTIRQDFRIGTSRSAKFENAVERLLEAEQSFDRGDWNAVGSKCRSSWRVLKGMVPKKDGIADIERLFSSVIGEPRRKAFGEAVAKGINDVLEKATHLEGDAGKDSSPVDLKREDALLCLHLTAALVSYVGSIRSI